MTVLALNYTICLTWALTLPDTVFADFGVILVWFQIQIRCTFHDCEASMFPVFDSVKMIGVRAVLLLTKQNTSKRVKQMLCFKNQQTQNKPFIQAINCFLKYTFSLLH